MKVSHPRVVYCNCVKFISSFPLVYEELGLQDIWQTDEQGDSYRPPKPCLKGYKYVTVS